MIYVINKLLIACGSNWVLANFNDLMDVISRNAVYANHITSHLEPGQIAYYNKDTHQVEIGTKH